MNKALLFFRKAKFNAIHTSGILPAPRLSTSFVGQCWTPDQGGIYRVAGYAQVRGAKLATTVAEGAILGPELITVEADRTFSSDTGWWTKQAGWGISGGVASITNVSDLGFYRVGLGTLGKYYSVTYIVTGISKGGFTGRFGSGKGVTRTSPGTYTDVALCIEGTGVGIVSVGETTGSIDNISIKEVIPVWIAPDTYPTRSVRTKLGTARVPTGTSVGMVSSPAFTNDLTCEKTNPDVTTGWTEAGGATIAIIASAAELAAAGLTYMASLGNLYEITWTAAGTVKSTATSVDTNKRCCRMISKVSDVVGDAIQFGVEDSTLVNVTASTLTSISQLDITPGSTTKKFTFSKAGGTGKLRFIAPEYVKSSYLPADPIVPLTPATDTLAAFTRAAVYAERDTAGVFPVVTEVAREYVPNNCFATLGAGGADVFASWTETAVLGSTVTQELVDLPTGFTSACKITMDGVASAVSIQQNLSYPIVAGSTPVFSFYVKSNAGNGLKFTVRIYDGVTLLYLSADGSAWSSSSVEWAPTDLPTSWGKYSKTLPTIPNGYTSLISIQVTRGNGTAVSKYITGISIGDTGIQNPYSTAATSMSDGSVVPVVAGASWAQNFAVFGTCVPDAGGVSGPSVFSSLAAAGNYINIIAGASSFGCQKYISTTAIQSLASYAYITNAPFDYLAIQTVHGMAIRIRPHATMTWSAWATNVTTNGKKPAPIGSKYQIGALNGASGIAGKHPKVAIYNLGSRSSLTAYQDYAMLVVGRI